MGVSDGIGVTDAVGVTVSVGGKGVSVGGCGVGVTEGVEDKITVGLATGWSCSGATFPDTHALKVTSKNSTNRYLIIGWQCMVDIDGQNRIYLSLDNLSPNGIPFK